MLIRPVELAAIRRGEVDLAFRRWDRARLSVGTKMRTAVGLIEVLSVGPVPLGSLRAEDAHRSGAPSLVALRRQLDYKTDLRVFRIEMRFAGDDPRVALRADDHLTAHDRKVLRDRLARLDRSSPRGAWTAETLAIIARRPAVRAPDLAAELGRDTVTFKRDVRKLKELGLTESLDVGYRLSPRGHALRSDGPSGP